MNYEMALELKDAGFPQSAGPGKATSFFIPKALAGAPAYNKEVVDRELVRDPSLSELIDACGNFKVFALKKFGNNDWQAAVGDGTGASETSIISDTYSTPEEAVKNLWLELNKK